MPKADAGRLAAELSDVRDMLMRSADALAAHGLIDGERLKDVKKLPGYRPIATDVATIVEVIRERWASVQNKTPLSLAELDGYAGRSLDLLASIGLKDQAPVTVGEAALNRQRAFTLFQRAYDDARRAVLYLRPKDGGEIAPSLYAGRGGRGRAEEGGSEAAAPSPVSEVGSAPVMTMNNSTGLPATSPFTS